MTGTDQSGTIRVDGGATSSKSQAVNVEPHVAEDEEDFLRPVRWWYASTAFPLVAGTFGPMASTFSICALVENWREYVPQGASSNDTVPISDPRWLIALNSLSLAIALVANIALFLNMAQRLPFNIAQAITISGFWIASVLLIVIIVYVSVDPWGQDVKEQFMGQAYYYAIFAAGLYMIISLLLCFTVYGAVTGQFSRNFKLTPAQRTLMLQTILYFVWQDLWSLGYSYIEDWTFLDAVYWADFTSLSVGLGGDFVPVTHLGRALLFPFALGGIILLGLVVGSIHSLVLDRSDKELAARLTEKTRQHLVKRIKRITSSGQPATSRTQHLPVRLTAGRAGTALTVNLHEPTLSEIDRRRLEFEAMRKVQKVSVRKRQYIRLFNSAFAFAFLWTIGAYVFYKAEKEQGWSYFVCLYFSYTTLLTIGYGDLVPESNAGKPFFVFWSLLAVPTLTILISNMGDTAIKEFKDFVIWMGEITILPSTDPDATRHRFKRGLFKLGLRKKPPDTEEEGGEEGVDDSSSSHEFRELHPGLVKLLTSDDEREGSKKRKDMQRGDIGERMATEFAEAEKLEEDEEKDKEQQDEEKDKEMQDQDQDQDEHEHDQAHPEGAKAKRVMSEYDKAARANHRYRRELLEQIKRVYTDALKNEKVHYSYDDWALFLHLLGEDESDPRYHIQPPSAAATDAAGALAVAAGGAGVAGTSIAAAEGSNPEIHKWSWLSPESMLMLNQDESEWVLSRLVDKLDQNIQEAQHALDEHKQQLRNTILLHKKDAAQVRARLRARHISQPVQQEPGPPPPPPPPQPQPPQCDCDCHR